MEIFNWKEIVTIGLYLTKKNLGWIIQIASFDFHKKYKIYRTLIQICIEKELYMIILVNLYDVNY